MSEVVRPRHPALVRVTHWLTALAFMALLVTGVEILISHPRFYWGETGNVNTRPLFSIPIPSSRSIVPTGYGYVLPDQNGWSRYLHFEAAWLAVLTGLLYVGFGFIEGHFRRTFFSSPSDFAPRHLARDLAARVRFARSGPKDASTYNATQRFIYLLVVFVLLPLIVWTGLCLSPAFESVFPAAVWILGGRQSARTIHLFVSVFLFAFVLVHVAMVFLAGFRSRVGAMITGRLPRSLERA